MDPREPDDVGPAVGGDLRVSDADRNQMLDLLTMAYAEGRLTRDLVPLDGPLPEHTASTPGTPSFPAIRPAAGGSRTDTLVGVLGGSTRKGKWQVSPQLRSFALMGGNELDFTEATFEAQEIVIEGFWVMGGLEITVPAGVNVQDRVMGVMGGTEIDGLVPHPQGPTIVLKGLAMMGGIEVNGPESKTVRRRLAKEARRARRHQRHGGDHGH